MTWRIHFTALDLARVRIGDALGPLAETMFGLSLVSGTTRPSAQLTGWRRRAQARSTPEMRMLASLVRGGSKSVDLWTLTGERPTIEQGISALRAMPEEHVLAELDYSARHTHLPTSAWELASPGSEAREQLAEAAQLAYRRLLEPHWTMVSAHLNAERMSRADVLSTGGVESLLATLCPAHVRWRAPVLEVQVPGQVDIHLDGRGLVLVPSLFVGERPALMGDLRGEHAPRLVFPVDVASMPGAHLLLGAPASPPSLSALMGSDRAAAMSRLAAGCTTGDLADHLAVSHGMASHHVTVLRQAGLLVTYRRDGLPWHALSALGLALLEAA